MSKKNIAKEYINFLKWLLKGFMVWLLFIVFVFLFLEPNFSFIMMLFAPFGSTGGEAYLWWIWLIILSPYIVSNIIRSIKWAQKNQKDLKSDM